MVLAVILAAGSGARFGSDKTRALIGGKPVWWHSYHAYLNHPSVDGLLIMVGEENEAEVQALAPDVLTARGGATRQASARIALDHAPVGSDTILFHDAARPFVSAELIQSVLDAVKRSGASAPALAVTDTIRQMDETGVALLDRSKLVAMQTPQGALASIWREAHRAAEGEFTDDMALIEAIGVQPEYVPGDPDNFKITLPGDLRRAQAMLNPMEVRTGLGYDVHRFSDDPSRVLMLGGVAFPEARALEGHSDADVLLHAAVDALLGAAALGDIGVHFPPSDERWRGEPSLTFLRHAFKLLEEKGWQIANLDIAVIAETPKIMPRAAEMRTMIATTVGLDIDQVSIKATTNEGLGSIGRGEGISAFATATIRR
jgi:2-C-methyl-D-erythritol 4-phosphate cytidylyltransferase / 2-C-methyl-D-erythritol 2,4-cyclodiphosphate synthase